MQPFKVLLCDLTHMGQRIAVDTFPYGVGCLAAFLEAHAPFPVEAHVAKFPDEVHGLLMGLKPQVVGFSNYVWNLHLSVEVAKRVKVALPGTAVVMGGPNFPREAAKQEEFLRCRSAVDFYIEGEGELALLELVTRLREADLDIEVVKRAGGPSVRCIAGDRFLAFPKAPRLKNLDGVPSPYLTHKLDRFFDYNLMPVLQTSRGCPFSCTYCVEGHSYYNLVTKRTRREVIREEVEYVARRVEGNRQLFIADSNFGMYAEDVDTAALLGRSMEEHDFPRYIHVATGKNRKDRVLECARLLKGRLRLSGSVQTLDPQVMENIRRKNISVRQLLDLAQEAREPGANTYSEIILGLPGDSLQAHLASIRGVVEAGFNIVLPWTFMFLKGSVAEAEGASRFGMRTRYRVLPRCFGEYRFGDETFLSGEVEEVCVDSDSLSLQEYLEARTFDLTTALFYNDRIFEEALGTAVAAGASPFKWLEEIHGRRTAFPPGLAAIYVQFRMDTLSELWESEEELTAFLCEPENMGRFIAGELGHNVLYTHRVAALTTAMRELNDIAFDAAEVLVAKLRPQVVERSAAYLLQLRSFALHRKERALEFDHRPVACYDYDFLAIQSTGRYCALLDPEPQGRFTHRFVHDPQQVAIIKEQIDFFGTDKVGLAKTFSRIPLQGLYRKVEVSVGCP